MLVCPQWVKSVGGLVEEVNKITTPHNATARGNGIDARILHQV